MNASTYQSSSCVEPAIPPLPMNWSYEGTVQKIETIVAQIESGDLELAEVFEQFSEAVTYLNQCESFLNERQRQMDLLIENLADHEPEI